MMRRRITSDTSGELQSLLEVIPDGALVVDSEDVVVDANKAATRIFDRPPGDLRGRTLATLLRPPGARAVAHTNTALDSRTVQLRSIHRTDGSTRQIELRTRRVARGPNRLCFVRDVTEETR